MNPIAPQRRARSMLTMGGNFNGKFMFLMVLFAVVFLVTQLTYKVDGFIKFGYILNTTACDTCDELRTYSGRNVFCCLAQSKCCG